MDTLDLTTSPPTLLQVQPGTSPYYYAGFLGSFLVLGGEVFDLSSGLPVQVSTLPPLAAGLPPIGFNGTQLLTGTIQTGMRVTNMTDLAQPQLTGVLIDRVETNTGVLSGQYVITANVGIRVYDAAPAGGGMDKATPLGPFLGSVAFDRSSINRISLRRLKRITMRSFRFSTSRQIRFLSWASSIPEPPTRAP